MTSVSYCGRNSNLLVRFNFSSYCNLIRGRRLAIYLSGSSELSISHFMSALDIHFQRLKARKDMLTVKNFQMSSSSISAISAFVF